MAIKFEGVPEHHKYLEAGTFVYVGNCNEKPAFACGFQSGDNAIIEFTVWWLPEQKIFMLGPSASKGTANGIAYVPGDEADDPTMALYACWIVNDPKKGYVACETMTCSWVAEEPAVVPQENNKEEAKKVDGVKKISAASVKSVSRNKGNFKKLECVIEEEDSNQNHSPNRQTRDTWAN